MVSTLAQALDLAERFPAHQVGVTVDTYHIWWDDTAPAQIARAGAQGRIHTFQLADGAVDTQWARDGRELLASDLRPRTGQ